MTSTFDVSVLGFAVLEEIEGAWTGEDFARLLERMEFGDTAGLGAEELREMCVMSLQDRKPAAAAALLLEHRLGDVLSKGQIQNISNEMLDEKLWEEYADMPLHERLFHVGSLLHQAFPRVVPVPDAVDVRLEVTAGDAEGAQILAHPLHESFLARLLAEGMPESATLNRLFEDAIRGAPFPEAESIVWIVHQEAVEPRTVHLRIVGSGHWLDALRGTKSFRSAARPDTPRGR